MLAIGPLEGPDVQLVDNVIVEWRWPEAVVVPRVARGGSVCLNRFSGLISGASAGFRPPRSAAAW